MRLVQALALVIVFCVMFAVSRFTSNLSGSMAVVASVGFLLLAGMLASELLELIGLPHLTGYLLAGIVAGPHILHLVEHDTVTRLSIVNTLALALIALAGGAELRLDMLRRTLKSLCWAMLLQTVLGLTALTIVFMAIGRFMPFTRELPLASLFALGLLWGVVAVSRSPAATLAILSQLRPRGPITQFALAFVMSSDVVVVVLLTLVMAIARPLLESGSTLSLNVFGALGHELVGSIALGTMLGLALAAYLRLFGGQLLLMLVAIGFGVTEGLRYLRFDPLLTFLIVGFVVQNFSSQGEKLLHAIEETGSVVFVVFFATAGAHLNLGLLRELWPFALVLAIGRAAVTWFAHRWSLWSNARSPTQAQALPRWASPR